MSSQIWAQDFFSLGNTVEESNRIPKFYEIFLVYLIFEAWPHYVAQASLELVVSQPLLLEC